MIIGVDEVGRGCLAGPVVVCAYRARQKLNLKLKDSKAYTAQQREELEPILRDAGDFVLIQKSSQEIDEFNILQACLRGMAEAIETLFAPGFEVFVDGHILPQKSYFKKNLEIPMKAIVKGDSLIYEISAASIIAKVYRDRLMKEFDFLYPGYDFASNKGYGTAKHLQAYKVKGPCLIHRHSFKPKELSEI